MENITSCDKLVKHEYHNPVGRTIITYTLETSMGRGLKEKRQDHSIETLP